MFADEKVKVDRSADAMGVPERIATVPPTVPARFMSERPPEKMVMTFPHLIIRITIAFMGTVIVMSLLAILVDSPLEELADPQHTPNPAKAPWYFLGLQELLHFFPPVVAGIALPLLVVLALVVVPYFAVNLKREGLWASERRRKFWWLTGSVAVIAAAASWFAALDIVVPTVIIYAVAVIPYFSGIQEGWVGWLGRRSLADWIMTWFAILVTVLTVVGTFFRGPGWSLIWPGQGGGH